MYDPGKIFGNHVLAEPAIWKMSDDGGDYDAG